MRELLDFLKDKITVRDIVEVYIERSQDLERAGKRYRCRCPLPDHPGDSTPSFTVYSDHFYCFGCRVAGDAIKFVLLMEQGSDPNFVFRDAVFKLKCQAIDWGLASEEDFARLGDTDLRLAEADLKEKWKDLLMKHNKAGDRPVNGRRFLESEGCDEGDAEPNQPDRDGLEAKLEGYQRALQRSSSGKDYLTSRGISIKTAIELGLGWSKRDQAIVFPVRDLKGRSVGYQLRFTQGDDDE